MQTAAVEAFERRRKRFLIGRAVNCKYIKRCYISAITTVRYNSIRVRKASF